MSAGGPMRAPQVLKVQETKRDLARVDRVPVLEAWGSTASANGR